MCAICIPYVRDSQIIIFYNQKYYETFWNRHGDYQKWFKISDGRSLMKERNIVTDLKEYGFKEILTDEDYTSVSQIWFYGEVYENNY